MNSNLQDKLQQFSANPPNGVWDKIADALDHEDSFVQRLYQYEESPPIAAWQAIEKGVEEEAAPAKVVPFTTRFRKSIRFAAVASIITVVMVTITLTFKRTEAGAIETGSNTTVPTNSGNHQSNTQDIHTAQSSSHPPLENQVNENSSSQKANTTEPQSNNTSVATSGNKDKHAAKPLEASLASSGHFILFKDGDGNLMKLPKKLYSLVNCKDGDGSCQQRLQQLRQKMAASAMTTDFTGILEMLRQLQ